MQFYKAHIGKMEVGDSGLRITAEEARMSLARCKSELFDERRHILLDWLALLPSPLECLLSLVASRPDLHG